MRGDSQLATNIFLSTSVEVMGIINASHQNPTFGVQREKIFKKYSVDTRSILMQNGIIIDDKQP